MDKCLGDLVTTVVMARNGGTMLIRTMAKHRGAVVYVDNGSTDGSADAVAESHPEFQVVRLPANVGAQARNTGVQLARTPYVAFADDDSWWAPGALHQAAAVLERHPEIAVVAARILVGADERTDPICTEMLDSPLPARPDVPGRSVVGFVACAAVVRRTAFLSAGGFDDVVFFGGEEERLTLDLMTHGWELVYVPDVVAHHDPQPSRDRRGRTAAISMNALLTALMRRRWRHVFRRAANVVRMPNSRSRLVTEIPRMVTALRRRRPVPYRVERRLELAREKRF